jgi:hypothetical protein
MHFNALWCIIKDPVYDYATDAEVKRFITVVAATTT